MQCKNCGAEIADKALICYRCGTATAEAKYKPAPLRRRASRSRIGVVILIIAVLLLLALYLLFRSASEKRQSHRGGHGGQEVRSCCPVGLNLRVLSILRVNEAPPQTDE
jgi:hypothetical protein